MDGPIYGSKAQEIGYRRGMEIFNLKHEKIFDVDLSGNLIDPITKKIRGHLQPAGAMPPDKSLDDLFC